MNSWRHRWTVVFGDGSQRDVMAQSRDGAMRTGQSAQRFVGLLLPRCRVGRRAAGRLLDGRTHDEVPTSRTDLT